VRLLLDANILLDSALQREGEEVANLVLNACQDSIHQGYVAWHSLAIFHYICSRKKGDAVTRSALATLLEFIEVAPADTSMAKMAVASSMKDFEDALQAIAAVKVGCDYIVTRNIKDFKFSVVPAILPENIEVA